MTPGSVGCGSGTVAGQLREVSGTPSRQRQREIRFGVGSSFESHRYVVNKGKKVFNFENFFFFFFLFGA